MWKFLILGVALYLFRSELRHLGPHWQTLMAIGAGIVVGFVYAGMLGRFGILDQAGQMLGVGPGVFGWVVLGASVFGGLKVFGPVIRSLFPHNGKGE